MSQVVSLEHLKTVQTVLHDVQHEADFIYSDESDQHQTLSVSHADAPETPVFKLLYTYAAFDVHVKQESPHNEAARGGGRGTRRDGGSIPVCNIGL